MKKIGIITIDRINNYGAELQAFALQYKMRILGYDAENIDLLFYKNRKFKATKKSRYLWKNSKKILIANFIKYKIVNFFIEVILPGFCKQQKNRIINFNSFHINNTKFSKEYCTYDSLYNDSLNYDCYVVGSDCTWCPLTRASIEPYFLTFAPNDKRKISYASSFGVSRIDGYNQAIYIKLLNNIDVISVRENTGKKIVKYLIGKDANVVLDPTLLLSCEEWKNISKKPSHKLADSYILIYSLYDSDDIVEIAEELSNKLTLPIIRVSKRSIMVRKDNKVVNIKDAGPAEFVYMIEHAKFVITDSFHGTVFAVNFNVNFYTVLNKTKKDNSRITDVLSLFQLYNRVLWTDEEHYISLENVDFSGVNEILNDEREKSCKILINSIEG